MTDVQVGQMNEEQLKEALDHDAVIKGAAQPPMPRTSPEPVAAVASQIETRNAILAKDLVSSFMQVAREFSGLSLMTGGRVATKGKNGEAGQPHYDSPKPAASLQCLEAALRAMELARMADALGDRAIVREKAE